MWDERPRRIKVPFRVYREYATRTFNQQTTNNNNNNNNARNKKKP